MTPSEKIAKLQRQRAELKHQIERLEAQRVYAQSEIIILSKREELLSSTSTID